MRVIRIDENSTESSINEIFELSEGSVFAISKDFVDTFKKYIPEGILFTFNPILKGTSDYERYGSDCYKIIDNKKTVVIE